MILTDRSRYQLQLGRCPRARYFNYHWGGTYGIDLKQTSVPLATGIYVHAALADICNIAKAGLEVSREITRAAISTAVIDYRQKVENSGFVGEESEDLQYLINEQSALIEALVWGFVKAILPKIIEEFEIIEVELEDGIVLGCTCKSKIADTYIDFTSNTPSHLDSCKGVAVILRNDLLLRRKSDRSLAIVDFKTAADIDVKYWNDQWEDNVQLGLYARNAKLRLGEDVGEAYIIGLNKGSRKNAKMPYDRGYERSGPKRQSSILIYGWQRAANPPNWNEDWQFKWDYVDGEGKNRTLKGKNYQWQPVWTGHFEFKPAGWTNIEYWIESLDEEMIQENFKFAGPFRTPDFLIDSLLESIEYNEREVEKKLVNQDKPTYSLNYTFPQSWECKRWNQNCQFLRLCKLEPGFQEPLKIGFKLRIPHHEIELKVAINEKALPKDIKLEGESDE